MRLGEVLEFIEPNTNVMIYISSFRDVIHSKAREAYSVLNMHNIKASKAHLLSIEVYDGGATGQWLKMLVNIE